MCFSCFRHSKYHKSIMPPPSFSVIFLMMSTFCRGQLFLVSIFYQLTSEKNEVQSLSTRTAHFAGVVVARHRVGKEKEQDQTPLS